MVHIVLEAKYDDFKVWAIKNEIHPFVIGFLGFRPDLLSTEVPSSTETNPAFCTPRAWNMLSNILKKNEDLNGIHPIVYGTVGYAVGIEFISFVKVYKTLPDIVLMDINLKGLETGIGAAKTIWESSKTPVVFLTSYSDDKTIKEAMESEPYGYLLKPCRDEELKVTIQTALHKHKYFFKNKDSKNEKKESKLLIECENGFSYHKSKNILYKDTEVIKLTGNETKLFDILSDYPNEPISYERIGDYIWGDDGDYTGKLRTLIYRVKNKLSYDLVENVYEMGYKLKIK